MRPRWLRHNTSTGGDQKRQLHLWNVAVNIPSKQ